MASPEIVSSIKHPRYFTLECYLILLFDVVRSYEKELQKTNQKEFRAENVKKRKGDKLYVK